MIRISIACLIACLTCLGFAIKYRAALPRIDGWKDLGHRVFKTVLAVVMICCITGCALFADSEAKRKELGKQLAALGTTGVVSLVTGNPLPVIGGAVNFLSFLFGGMGAAYGIAQRHKVRQAIAADSPPPGQDIGKTVLPAGQDPGAYAPNPQNINGGRVAA